MFVDNFFVLISLERNLKLKYLIWWRRGKLWENEKEEKIIGEIIFSFCCFVFLMWYLFLEWLCLWFLLEIDIYCLSMWKKILENL